MGLSGGILAPPVQTGESICCSPAWSGEGRQTAGGGTQTLALHPSATDWGNLAPGDQGSAEGPLIQLHFTLMTDQCSTHDGGLQYSVRRALLESQSPSKQLKSPMHGQNSLSTGWSCCQAVSHTAGECASVVVTSLFSVLHARARGVVASHRISPDGLMMCNLPCYYC